MVPAKGAKRVSRAETSRHKERASLLTKAGGDTLCWGWAHNSPFSVGLESQHSWGTWGAILRCPRAHPNATPPTRRAFLHLRTSPNCLDVSPATALCFCSSQRQCWEEREDLQHVHRQSSRGFEVSKRAEAPWATPDTSWCSQQLCSCASSQLTCASVSPPVADWCATKSGCMRLSQDTPKNWGGAAPAAQGSLCAGSCAARPSAFPPRHTASCWPPRAEKGRAERWTSELVWVSEDCSKQGPGRVLRLVRGTEFL